MPLHPVSIYDTTISKRTSDASEGTSEVNSTPTKKRATGTPVRPRTSHSQSPVIHTEIDAGSTPSPPHALTPLQRKGWVDTRSKGLLKMRDASTTRSTELCKKELWKKVKDDPMLTHAPRSQRDSVSLGRQGEYLYAHFPRTTTT